MGHEHSAGAWPSDLDELPDHLSRKEGRPPYDHCPMHQSNLVPFARLSVVLIYPSLYESPTMIHQEAGNLTPDQSELTQCLHGQLRPHDAGPLDLYLLMHKSDRIFSETIKALGI